MKIIIMNILFLLTFFSLFAADVTSSITQSAAESTSLNQAPHSNVAVTQVSNTNSFSSGGEYIRNYSGAEISPIVTDKMPESGHSSLVSSSAADSPVEIQTVMTVEQPKAYKSDREKKIWESWKFTGPSCDTDFSEYLFSGDLFKPSFFTGRREIARILMGGLKSDYCIAKWQSIYKLCEFLDVVEVQELRKILSGLLMKDDEDEKIKIAAAFAISIIDKDFSAEDWFIRSPDGKKYVFTGYKEVRYTGYEVWLVENGRIYKKPFPVGTVSLLTWSPDGKYVVADSYTRIQTWFTVIDINNKKIYPNIDRVYPDWYREHAEKHGISAINNNQPLNTRFLSWGTDGKSVIVSWERGEGLSGTVEFDFINGKTSNFTFKNLNVPEEQSVEDE